MEFLRSQNVDDNKAVIRISQNVIERKRGYWLGSSKKRVVFTTAGAVSVAAP